MIQTSCYGVVHKFDTSQDAKRFYMLAAISSEGSEKERYMNILMQLEEGLTMCYDEC